LGGGRRDEWGKAWGFRAGAERDRRGGVRRGWWEGFGRPGVKAGSRSDLDARIAYSLLRPAEAGTEMPSLFWFGDDLPGWIQRSQRQRRRNCTWAFPSGSLTARLYTRDPTGTARLL
jgi:hypothetical protein